MDAQPARVTRTPRRVKLTLSSSQRGSFLPDIREKEPRVGNRLTQPRRPTESVLRGDGGSRPAPGGINISTCPRKTSHIEKVVDTVGKVETFWTVTTPYHMAAIQNIQLEPQRVSLVDQMQELIEVMKTMERNEKFRPATDVDSSHLYLDSSLDFQEVKLPKIKGNLQL